MDIHNQILYTLINRTTKIEYAIDYPNELKVEWIEDYPNEY